MGLLRSFFSNLGDAFATGGDRHAFMERRGRRLQDEGRDAEWNAFLLTLNRIAVEAWNKSAEGRAYIKSQKDLVKGPHLVQYEDDNYRVEVRGDYQIDHDAFTTSVYVIPRKQSGGGHWHVVFDDNGNIVHNGWRDTGAN